MTDNKRFETLREDLHARFGHSYTANEINARLDWAIEKHTANAQVDEFLPVLIEREVTEYLGDHRLHVRFAAGADHSLAHAAAVLTQRLAGEALYVDTATQHPENGADTRIDQVLAERGLGEDPSEAISETRMVTMPDFIIFLGREVPRDEAGKEIKIWDLPTGEADDIQGSRELADDLEARVFYMLNKLGITPLEQPQSDAAREVVAAN